MEDILTSIFAFLLVLVILVVPFMAYIAIKRLKQIVKLLTIITDYYREKKIVHLNNNKDATF